MWHGGTVGRLLDLEVVSLITAVLLLCSDHRRVFHTYVSVFTKQ